MFINNYHYNQSNTLSTEDDDLPDLPDPNWPFLVPVAKLPNRPPPRTGTPVTVTAVKPGTSWLVYNLPFFQKSSKMLQRRNVIISMNMCKYFDTGQQELHPPVLI